MVGWLGYFNRGGEGVVAHSKEMGAMRKMAGGSLKDKGKYSLHTMSPPLYHNY